MTDVWLPFDLPEELSDEAVAQLVECLYEFGRCLENRYYGQLCRYYEAAHCEPGADVDPRQRSLWDEEEALPDEQELPW